MHLIENISMKKKTRSIIVIDKNYEWLIVEDDWPNGTLKVWIDGDKNNMLFSQKVLVVEPIRPSHVASFIEEALRDIK